MEWWKSFVVCVAVLLGSPALAHDDAYMDTLKAPHGGQLRMAGPYHYELVVAKDSRDIKANPVVVYVTDHAGQKIPTAAAAGTATFFTGKRKTTAALKPDGDNRMRGFAQYAPAPGMKVAVSIALAGKPPEQASFTPAVAVDHDSGHKH